jgi:hypothetical protein
LAISLLNPGESGRSAGELPDDPAECAHASTVLTSNKSFEEWGEIFGDEVMAAVLIDRLLHHCHIVNIRGNSFRMRHHTDLSKQLHQLPDGDSASASSPSRRTPKKKELTT